MHLVVPPGGSFREARRIELGPRVLTIGRAPGADVRIDLPGVDDEHAKISEIALIAVGQDCAIGDVPLDAGQRRLVMPGDEIQIGSVVFSLHGDDPSADATRAPTIRVVEGKNFGDELELSAENQEYVIGRSPKAQLILDDREVSREHVKVVRRGPRVFLYDAASTRGSWLGRSAVYQGTRIEWQRPRMLKLGATVLALDMPFEHTEPRGSHAPPPMTPAPRVAVKLADAASPAADASGAPGNVVAYHYQAKSPSTLPEPEVAAPPPTALSRAPEAGVSRRAWKTTGPTVGRATGLLLLALAGALVLCALFVVFSLME